MNWVHTISRVQPGWCIDNKSARIGDRRAIRFAADPATLAHAMVAPLRCLRFLLSIEFVTEGNEGNEVRIVAVF